MIRTSLVSIFLVACGGGGGTSSDTMTGDDMPPLPDAPTIDPPARGFQIVTPDFDVGPQQEITVCYYFRTPNTEPMAITDTATHDAPAAMANAGIRAPKVPSSGPAIANASGRAIRSNPV